MTINTKNFFIIKHERIMNAIDACGDMLSEQIEDGQLIDHTLHDEFKALCQELEVIEEVMNLRNNFYCECKF